MKKLLFGALALFLAACFVSCKDNDNPKYYYSYGTVVEPDAAGGDLRIRKDAGRYLTVEGWTGGLETGDRVIVVYEVKGKLVEGGDNTVKLASIYHVLTKDPVKWSMLADDDEENGKLGNDGLVDISAWFGGEYLNVDFRTYFAHNSSIRHFINLTADDVEFDGETLTVKLRHNAYREVPGNEYILHLGDGMVSFNLVNLFEDMEIDEADYPKIVLEWEQYDGTSTAATTTRTVELGRFTPWEQEQQVERADVLRTEAVVE